MAIPRREAITILNSLAAGVTPRAGLRHIAVGRSKEVNAIKQDLDQIAADGASIRFIIGRYGSGKSFLLQLIRSYALDSKFVVADVDFSPERRLFGSSDEAISTYRELARNISTQTRPDGNALPIIIEKWIAGVQSQVMQDCAASSGSPEFVCEVEKKIVQTLSAMHELVHGFDFAQVINAYFRGYLTGDDTLKNNAIRWLRGEFPNKTEASQALGVKAIIDSDNYYDYLKILARFVRNVGYTGLLICFDEAAYLYKISNSISRKNNYEAILNILNDCLQGKASSIGFIFGGTPEFMEDSRRGLYSYEALRSRLSGNRFATAEMQDLSGPVLLIPSLTNEEIFVLLQKVRDIYNSTILVAIEVSDSNIHSFMESTLRRIGSREFTTPRELIRDFVSLLNLLVQYPEKKFGDLAGEIIAAQSTQDPTSIAPEDVQDEDDPLDRFTNFKVN
ncbi:MAG: ATP-binding protein [Pelolinea sp.]|nr:ATP-binding protein [Pelolinea sp.]